MYKLGSPSFLSYFILFVLERKILRLSFRLDHSFTVFELRKSEERTETIIGYDFKSGAFIGAVK